MCRREVYKTRCSCGHDEPSSERKIDCNSTRCRNSALHPLNCPVCHTTCVRRLDEARPVVTGSRDGLCYHCKRGVAGLA